MYDAIMWFHVCYLSDLRHILDDIGITIEGHTELYGVYVMYLQ